jgi:hypothetical protein
MASQLSQQQLQQVFRSVSTHVHMCARVCEKTVCTFTFIYSSSGAVK